MPGNHFGGVKAGKTNKERHGEDFYRKIGKLGGAKSKGGSFNRDPELARRAGRLGGLASRRGKAK